MCLAALPQAVMKIDLTVSQSTTAAQLEALRRRINAYLESQALSWRPSCMIRAGLLRDQAITLTVWVQVRSAWPAIAALWRVE